MSVENVHHRAPITVADRSGVKPGAAPGKPDPARTKSGNANAPVTPLADIKSDPKPYPKRALSRDIDVGLGDIRSGKANDDKEKVNGGKTRIATGIGNVVMYITGQNLRATYDQAKPATDEILVAHSRRSDGREVVDGVNNYLQGIVVYDMLLARAAVSDSSGLNEAVDRLDKALETAKKYVTDAGPNSRIPADRLESLINAMTDAGISQPILDATRMRCEEATGSKP